MLALVRSASAMVIAGASLRPLRAAYSATATSRAPESETSPASSDTPSRRWTALEDLPLPAAIAPRKRQRPAPVSLAEAVASVKASAKARFVETVEISLVLGTDPRRGDHMVRGSAMLPAGRGKAVRVAAFCGGEAAEAARAAGAELVGLDDLVSRIADGGAAGISFDAAVATPDAMPRVGKIARLLGPRGLMPNPKLGTVAADLAPVIRQLKMGRVEFRADRTAIVSAGIGLVSFAEADIAENAAAFAAAVLAARPKALKGSGIASYVKAASISSTMGPGVPLSVNSLVQAAQARAV